MREQADDLTSTTNVLFSPFPRSPSRRRCCCPSVGRLLLVVGHVLVPLRSCQSVLLIWQPDPLVSLSLFWLFSSRSRRLLAVGSSGERETGCCERLGSSIRLRARVPALTCTRETDLLLLVGDRMEENTYREEHALSHSMCVREESETGEGVGDGKNLQRVNRTTRESEHQQSGSTGIRTRMLGEERDRRVCAELPQRTMEHTCSLSSPSSPSPMQ